MGGVKNVVVARENEEGTVEVERTARVARRAERLAKTKTARDG